MADVIELKEGKRNDGCTSGKESEFQHSITIWFVPVNSEEFQLPGSLENTTTDTFGSKVMVELFREINEIPTDLAKSKIRALLDKNPGLDAYDIAESLNLDIRQVWKLCDELVAEKKIQPKNE